MESKINRPTAASGGFVFGSLLVVTGIFLLLAQYLPSDYARYGWALFVVMAGGAFLFIGMTARSVSGLVIPGSIITVVGLILAVQETFGLYATWTYAWALAFPGSFGLGLAIQGTMVGRSEQVRVGARMMTTGAVLFLIFGAIFEGIFQFSGRGFGAAGDTLIPLALIATGVLLIAIRFVGGRPAATPPTQLPAG